MKYIDMERAIEVCRKHFARCWENYVAGAKIAEEIKQEIEDLPEAWISVKDRLPEKEGKYLVYINDGRDFIGMACFYLDLHKFNKYEFPNQHRPGWCQYDSEWGDYEVSNVTHWMPLPEPPKEDEREES